MNELEELEDVERRCAERGLECFGCVRSRGHLIADVTDAPEDDWVHWDLYADDLSPYDSSRPCPKCGATHAKGNEEPDACWGWLSGVRFACCGHGYDDDAYVVLKGGGRTMRGAKAMRWVIPLALCFAKDRSHRVSF